MPEENENVTNEEFDSELHGMKDCLVKSVSVNPVKPIASDLTIRLAVDHGEQDVEMAARPRNNVARYLPKSTDGPEYYAENAEENQEEPAGEGNLPIE